MSIDITKLQYSPVLQQVFVDPNTAVAAVGSIYFYKNTDHNTLKPVYKHSGNPSDPFEAAPNPIELNTAGALPYHIYLYPFDDEGLPDLYYVEGERTDSSVFYQQDFVADYYDGAGGGGNSSTAIENLCPSYGFDSIIWNGLYPDGYALTSGAGTYPVSNGWFLDINTTDITQKIIPTYAALGDASIIGNPKNELSIEVQNTAASGDTWKRLRYRLGYYNNFNNVALAFSAFVTLTSGATTSVPIKLMRTKNGVAQTPVNIGTFTLSGSRNQRIIAFTPSFSDTGYVNSDTMDVFIDLPINADFIFKITGTWSQESPDGGVQISEENTELYSIKQFMGSSLPELQDIDVNKKYGGFPLAMGVGVPFFINRVGSIFLAPNSASFPGKDVVKMDTDTEIIGNKARDHTTTDRIIETLRAEGITNSIYTLIATNPSANVLSVTSGAPYTPTAAWSATSANIAYSKITEEWEMGFGAQLDVINDGDYKSISLTYKINGVLPAVFPYNPETLDSVGTDSLFTDGYAEPTTVSYVANYMGALSWVNSIDHGESHSIGAAFVLNDYVTSIDGSGAAPAVYNLFLKNSLLSKTPFTAPTMPSTEGDLPIGRTSDYNYDFYKTRNVTIKTYLALTEGTLNYPLGYMAWNAPGDAFSPPSLRFILAPNFEGDNAPSAPAPASGGLKKTFTVNQSSTLEDIAVSIASVLNNSAVHEFTFSGLPANGGHISINTKDTKFSVIFYDTGDAKPANPDATSLPFYVEFTQSSTIADVINSTIAVIHSMVIGIPYYKQFLLKPIPDYNYYMNI